eukprot:1153086-Pelagomonas_calceolata.AAC.6
MKLEARDNRETGVEGLGEQKRTVPGPNTVSGGLCQKYITCKVLSFDVELQYSWAKRLEHLGVAGFQPVLLPPFLHGEAVGKKRHKAVHVPSCSPSGTWRGS